MDVGDPGYVGLREQGELARRAGEAIDRLADCTLCGRGCRADRLHGSGANAFCRGTRIARISSVFPHRGEEPCLSGSHGSGTIFFSDCNLRCVFCQNYDISCQGEGCLVTADELAAAMLHLQDAGCHNVNFVTPSHVVPQILEALPLAVDGGLRLPLVYNTGGYDAVETLQLLDGIIDIYMPDFKFWDAAVAKELLHAGDYREVACAAFTEMHRQVGDLVIDADGIARRGLLVRHLVMPGMLDDTRRIMRYLAGEISPDTFVNIMPQYHPAGLAHEHPAINRRLMPDEYDGALDIAREEGLHRFSRP